VTSTKTKFRERKLDLEYPLLCKTQYATISIVFVDFLSSSTSAYTHCTFSYSTVGYLLGETEDDQLFKDPDML